MAETKDLAALRSCMCAGVRRAGRALTNLYDEILAPSGLRVTQFSLLAGLAGVGEATLTCLAAASVMDRTTLTRNLAPLERDGYVAITPGADRRTRIVRITDEGRAALERARPYWHEAQQRVTAALGGERFGALLKELEEVVALTQ
jgi:DNA-binding MarR family transcriptional regulator